MNSCHQINIQHQYLEHFLPGYEFLVASANNTMTLFYSSGLTEMAPYVAHLSTLGVGEGGGEGGGERGANQEEGGKRGIIE